MADAATTTLAEFERKMQEWHRRRYGGRPVDQGRALMKLFEEIGELGEALGRYDVEDNADSALHVAEEAADVVMVLHNLVRSCHASLAQALVAKLAIIYKRLETEPGYDRAWYDKSPPRHLDANRMGSL